MKFIYLLFLSLLGICSFSHASNLTSRESEVYYQELTPGTFEWRSLQLKIYPELNALKGDKKLEKFFSSFHCIDKLTSSLGRSWVYSDNDSFSYSYLQYDGEEVPASEKDFVKYLASKIRNIEARFDVNSKVKRALLLKKLVDKSEWKQIVQKEKSNVLNEWLDYQQESDNVTFFNETPFYFPSDSKSFSLQGLIVEYFTVICDATVSPREDGRKDGSIPLVDTTLHDEITQFFEVNLFFKAKESQYKYDPKVFSYIKI